MLEKTLESPLDCRDIKPVNPKGNQSGLFIGRTDAEATICWPTDVKNWLIGKDPDAGKDWRQEEKGTTEDEMVGWHHQLDELEFEQAPGVGDGQGSLACYSPWDHKETCLNWNEMKWIESGMLGYSILQLNSKWLKKKKKGLGCGHVCSWSPVTLKFTGSDVVTETKDQVLVCCGLWNEPG